MLKNKLIVSFVLLFASTAICFAQSMGPKKQTRMISGMQHTMLYSSMVRRTLMKAEGLNLTEEQKKELSNIKEQYLYPMVRKEADFRVSHMKIMDMLRDPDFDPLKVKSEIKRANDINLEIANMSIDALAAIRKAIGPENFKKIKTMPMMGKPYMKRGGTSDSNDSE